MTFSTVDKVALVMVRDGRVLMTRSVGREVFYLPGGKREPGETDAQALMREVREELGLGLSPKSMNLLGSFDALADGKPGGIAVRMTCYSASATGDPVASNEIAELAWFAPADFLRASLASQLVLHWLQARGIPGP